MAAAWSWFQLGQGHGEFQTLTESQCGWSTELRGKLCSVHTPVVGGPGAVFLTCAGIPDRLLLTLVLHNSHLSPKASITETIPAMVSKIAVGFIFIAFKIGCFLCFLISLVVFIPHFLSSHLGLAPQALPSGAHGPDTQE